ncbi:thioesterase family protein [Bacillus sp. 1P06AnD]|uniref:thioesterase family protein n=1 Tax=Bacillus sp. 1P06AnD TaxID=3132208 RepID=UPI00399FE300
MKPGMKIGMAESITVEVSEDMFARFEDKVIHPAFSTVSMVYHMEWASRKIILPYLNEDEEGLGASVNLKHTGMSPAHSKVTITAVLKEIVNNIIVTEVEAFNEKERIGVGTVKQIVLPKAEIEKKLS